METGESKNNNVQLWGDNESLHLTMRGSWKNFNPAKDTAIEKDNCASCYSYYFLEYLACYVVILVLKHTPQEYLQKAELKLRLVHQLEIQWGDVLHDPMV